MKYYLDKELQREVQIKELDGVKSVFEGNTLIGAMRETKLYADCTEERKDIGSYIANTIKDKGYTDKEIYNLTGISRASLRLYKLGLNSMTFDQLIRIGDVLGFKVVLEPVEGK